MQVVVKSLDGLPETYVCQHSDTVENLKRLISDRLGHPLVCQTLVLDKEPLKGDATRLSAVGVQDGSTLLLLLNRDPGFSSVAASSRALQSREPLASRRSAVTSSLESLSPRKPPVPEASPSECAGTACCACSDLKHQLLAQSAQSARAHTERHDAMKACRQARDLQEDAEEELVTLRGRQTKMTEEMKATELELDEVRRHRDDTEAQWREEASAWQGAYDAAKASAERARGENAEAEKGVEALDSEVQELRRALEESQWDLDDARAACAATEQRVFSDAGKVDEEVKRAQATCFSEQAAAEVARAEAATAEARLIASCSRLAETPASRKHPETELAIAGLLAMHRAEADVEEQRCKELESAAADWHQRVQAGRSALGRLRELHQEATLRINASGAAKRRNTVDRSSSPYGRQSATEAEKELSARLREWEAKLRCLEEENQQLKQMQQLDAERHGVKTERLRLKAERYKIAHAELRRLYLEQQEGLL